MSSAQQTQHFHGSCIGCLTRQLLSIAVDYADDPETGHIEADKALLAFINVPDVSTAYEAVRKWHA